MNYKRILKALFSVVMLTTGFAANAVTPSNVMQKAAAKINNSNAISCTFTIAGNGSSSVSGTLTASKNEFSIITGASSVWYNGTSMWTLNPSTKEVTLTTPTQSEIAESNPLYYVRNYSSNYRLYFSKRTEKGSYLVLLNPIKSGSGIKAVEIAVNKSSYVPTRIIVRYDDDRRATVNLGNINYNANVSSTSFTYPASKYKGYELVDLR